MLIKTHPKLQPWPPTSGIACVGATPSQKKIGSLILKFVRIGTPARLVMSLDYMGADCLYTVDFKDTETAASIHRTLQHCTGMTLKQIGDMEIR